MAKPRKYRTEFQKIFKSALPGEVVSDKAFQEAAMKLYEAAGNIKTQLSYLFDFFLEGLPISECYISDGFTPRYKYAVIEFVRRYDVVMNSKHGNELYEVLDTILLRYDFKNEQPISPTPI